MALTDSLDGSANTDDTLIEPPLEKRPMVRLPMSFLEMLARIPYLEGLAMINCMAALGMMPTDVLRRYHSRRRRR